ncbi:MAG: TSUP family transporter, partial [Betaproteobacteria bacterium]
MDFLFVVSGLLVGLIIGVSGVGGGSLMTPLLVMGFGVPPATAVGTDLLYAGLTKTGCSIFRGKLGSINWKLASLLALGSLPAAILTSIYFLGPTHVSSQTSSVITQTLGFMLCVTAVSFVFRKRLIALSGSFIPTSSTRSQKILIATLLLGAV